MRRPILIAAAVATLLGSLGFAAPTRASTPVKVAIIVGPVGEALTPVYIGLAEAAATAAETRGASVARAYSPDATVELVLAAVEDANIVIYFGHGVGTPNPYSATPSATTTNGWGLNGPNAVGTHADSWSDGTLAYYGEAWIAEHARPAPGWVMIYSNACYAPGASEGHDPAADEATAAGRVSAYSRAPLADLGASGYFATDFYEGAAHLVGALLEEPDRAYGEVFASEPRFSADALDRLPHASVEGAETWLHRSPYFEGKVDYWYAFAGNPAASLTGGLGAWAPLPELDAASAPETGFGVQETLYPVRHVMLGPGPVEGRTYRTDGSVASVTAVDFDEPLIVTAYAVAIVNGVEHVLVADGPLAGLWVPSEHVKSADTAER